MNPRVSTRFNLCVKMSGLTRDGYNIKPVSLDQVLRREQGRSAHHEQDWQAYPVSACIVPDMLHFV